MLNIKTLSKVAPHLFMWLFLTNMIDAATTTILIHWGGIDVEVNPFMKAIIIHHGALGMVMFKCLAILFLWFVHDIIKKYYPQYVRSITIGLTAVCVVYTLLALHNMWAVYYVWSVVQ